MSFGIYDKASGASNDWLSIKKKVGFAL